MFRAISIVLIGIICFYYPLSAKSNTALSDTIKTPELKLKEVEITAMRESGKISRLPVTAGVIDSHTITNNQIQSMTGLGSFVPNVMIPDYGSRLTSPVYIRGIGSRINAPSVGLYVDNIPYFEKSVFDFDLINIDRIEVLRGPQGTLYGRNTMGGLINVFSVSPFRPQQTSIAITGGNHAYLNGTITHNQLLSTSTGLAVSAGVNRHDGFFRNEFSGDNADAHFSTGSRLRLGHQFSSALHIELISHAEYLDQGGYPYAIHDLASDQTQPVNYNQPSYYQRKMFSNGLLFGYETQKAILQSVSSHQYFSDRQSIDQDFTPYELVFAVQQQAQHMLSQEITVRNRKKGHYQWVTGAFAFAQYLDNDLQIDFGNDAVAMGLVPEILSRFQLSKNHIWGAAIFHQSSISDFLLPGLTLTGGIRLDYEQAGLDYSAYMEADFDTPPPEAFNSKRSYYELLPRVAILYALTQQSGVFGTITKGYKTGGFNVVFEREEDRSFEPEYSWNYEIGLRGTFLNGHLNIQTAMFYIDWENQQIYQMLPSGQGSMLGNAGSSVSKGAELEIHALLNNQLQLRANYGYTHAVFTENAPNPDTDLSGNFIPYIPRHTLFSSIQYHRSVALGSLHAILMQLSYRGVGKHYWDQQNTFFQPWYGLINLMVSFEIAGFFIDAWAHNINSADYHSFSFHALGNHYVQKGRPTTFGMNVRVSF